MRQMFIAIIAYFALNIFFPKLWEVVMSGAPDWVKKLATFAAALVCVLFIVLSDPVFSTLKAPKKHPLTSTLAVIFLGGALAGSAWWIFAAGSSSLASGPTEIARRPSVYFANVKLVIPKDESDPLRILLSLVNSGDTDAVVTIEDGTYAYTLDPSQTAFKYGEFPPDQFVVRPGPGVVQRGELRFEFRMTPERIAALNSGKARLFFFARGSYSYGDGNVHPLPYRGMYDRLISGNLRACPPEITVE